MRVPRLPWLALCAQPRRASRVMVVEPGPCLMPRGVGGVPRARVRTWTMLCAVASGCGKEGRQADDVQYDWCRDSLYVGGAAVLYVRAAFRGPCYVLAGCLPCSVYVWGGVLGAGASASPPLVLGRLGGRGRAKGRPHASLARAADVALLGKGERMRAAVGLRAGLRDIQGEDQRWCELRQGGSDAGCLQRNTCSYTNAWKPRPWRGRG
mmetsp:Transcript_63648/g.174743  ORF Transcript_63648/g.174743 Transcript_63648/m.174743 type:complete len:209 (+) Transcript_63648:171-797(+)